MCCSRSSSAYPSQRCINSQSIQKVLELEFAAELWWEICGGVPRAVRLIDIFAGLKIDLIIVNHCKLTHSVCYTQRLV